MPGEERQGDALETPAFRLRLRRRETAAWELAYEAYEQRMRRITFRILPPHHDREAAAQQAWVQALHRARRMDPQRSTGAWLASICVHLCISLLRREGRRMRLLGDRTKAPSTPRRGIAEVPGHIPMASRVREVVRRLSSDQQQIIYLRFACEMRLREIAEVMDVPENTVRKRLSRAYGRLRRELGDDGLEGFVTP